MVSSNFLAYQNYIWRKYSGVPMEFYDPNKYYGSVTVIGSQYTITGTGQVPQQTESVTYEQPPNVQPHEAYYGMSIPYSYLTPTERFQFNVATGGTYSAQYSNVGYNPAAMQKVEYVPKIEVTEKPIYVDTGQQTATYVTVQEAQRIKQEQAQKNLGPGAAWYGSNVLGPAMQPIEQRMAYVESIQGSSPLLWGAQAITRGAVGSVVGVPMLILNPGEALSSMAVRAATNPAEFALESVGGIGMFKFVGRVSGSALSRAGLYKPPKITYEVTEVHNVDFGIFKRTTTEYAEPIGIETEYTISKGIGLDMRMQAFSPKDLMNPKPLNIRTASETIDNVKYSFIQKEGMFPRITKYTTDVKPKIQTNIVFRDVGAGAVKKVRGYGNIISESTLFLRRSIPFSEPATKAGGAFKVALEGERRAFTERPKPMGDMFSFKGKMYARIPENEIIGRLADFTKMIEDPLRDIRPARNMPVEGKIFNEQPGQLLKLEESEFYRFPGETLEPGKGIPIAIREIRPLSAADISFNILGTFKGYKSAAEGRVNVADMATKSVMDLRSFERMGEMIKPKEMVSFQNINISLNRQYLEPMRIQESLRSFRQIQQPRIITPAIPAESYSVPIMGGQMPPNLSRIKSLQRDIMESTRGFKYSPSLYSISTGFTTTKKQFTITGLELRPVIRRRKK